ncbi:MAG: glutamate--tRNA ligase family protein [Stutzerimonas stutzeri]
MTTVRTRIAPSPTGEPHVGTAYIALFNCASPAARRPVHPAHRGYRCQLRSTP